MAIIYCSNKLKTFLGAKYFQSSENQLPSPYGHWNAHLFYVEGKKYLILMHNLTRYSVVLPKVVKADFSDLEALFFPRLLAQMQYDGVGTVAQLADSLRYWSPLQLAPTNNDKSVLGSLNDFLFRFELQRQYRVDENPGLELLNHLLNDSPVGSRFNKAPDACWPIVNMRKLLLGIPSTFN
jgi:hypothetical protein